ncbi:ABC transporter ATP-binding protein [Pseudonocardia sp. NPDC049635]|uniref:ABC transporter ATP-binding protein n=1 Tax=Pseudonocardia sp. NPDC049635 TaxID=3155506 RepID=UPI0033FBAE0B
MIRTLLSLLPDGSRRTVVAHAAFTVLTVLLRAAAAVLLVPLVGALFGPDPSAALPWLAVLTAVTVGGWATDVVVARLGFRIGFSLLDRTQHAMADRLTRIRLGWLDADNTATARASIGSGGPELVGLIVYLVTPLASALLLPAAIAVALFWVAWPLGLAAAAAVPVLFGVLWASGRITRRSDEEAAATNRELTERIVEFARTQQALRAARRVDPARSEVGRALGAQHGATLRLLLFHVPGQLLFGIAAQIALILLAGTTTLLAVRGTLSAPEAIALVVVLARFLEPFTALADLAGGIGTTRATLRRIRAVLDAPTDPAGPGGPLPAAAPRVELDGVTFGYRADGPPVLDRLDLTLEPGSTTAIVGPSGSGKSTILALLAGLHHPDRGTIRVDGVDVARLDAGQRRALVSMVFQDPYLFEGTLRDNVLVGAPDADPATLAAVTGAARVREIVDRLPDGDRSRIGEAGTTLSGGERQRIGIARALLKPAPLLLVDEATSALDTETETAVVQALSADPYPRTRVVVAHRLASIRHADRVLFVEDGRIVEDGTVAGLRAAGGRFAEFWRHQELRSAWRWGETAATPG